MKQENEVHLYDIVEAFKELEDKLEDDLSLQEYLDAIKLDLVQKTDQIIMVMRGAKLTSDAIGNELDRLASLKKYYDTKEAKLKSYLDYNMQKIGKDRLETEKAVLTYRKSETTDILDETLIPAEYRKVRTTETIDKTSIKDAIKNGVEVPGATVTTHLNLQIK